MRTNILFQSCGAIVSLAIAALLAQTAHADVRMPKIFGDHMVLQRDQPIPVWGWASADEAITIKLNGAEVSTVAGKDGKWKVALPVQKAGGPFTLTITGKNTVKFDDVLIGEVWFCSGQSNMDMRVAPPKKPVDGILDREKVLAAASNPKVRLFHVDYNWQRAPIDDVKGRWLLCEPKYVADYSAVAYLFATQLQKELDVPVAVITAAMGGMPINQFSPPPDPAFWYNGMIAPVIPYGIRGALWYQGETDMNLGMEYFRRQKRLIEGWRNAWGQGQFPFYFVQIAPFAYSKGTWPVKKPPPDFLPLLWEAQTASLAVPNTDMVVITDVGDPKDIHPKNKQPVADRLARLALANTYGRKDIVFSGPRYSHSAVEGDHIRIHFDHVAGGLVSRDGKPLDWFTIAGKDKKFVPAEATIDGDAIIVRSKEVADPAAVRFGWHETAQPNLVNKAGLPTAPFRTDDWPPDAARK